MRRPAVLMSAIWPPMAFALPGETPAAVTPASSASRKAWSIGLTASMARICGVTGSVSSLPSAPSKPRPSSYRPRWEWMSMRPGVSTPPSPSSTSLHAGGSPSPSASIFPFFSRTQPKNRLFSSSIVRMVTFLIRISFMKTSESLLTDMVLYGIFIMAAGKAAMHRSYLYPHTSAPLLNKGRIFLRRDGCGCSASAHKNKTEAVRPRF